MTSTCFSYSHNDEKTNRIVMTMANKQEKYVASPSMNGKFRHDLNQSYDRLIVETQIYSIDVQLNFGSAIEANIDSLLGGEVQWHCTGHFLDWANLVLFLLRVAFHSIEKISLRKRAPTCRWKSRLKGVNSDWSSGVEKIGKRRKSPVPRPPIVLIANVNGRAAYLQVQPVGFLLQWNSSMTKLVDKVICPAYTQQQFRLNLIKRPGIPCKWWRAHVWWMAKCCSFSSKYL